MVFLPLTVWLLGKNYGQVTNHKFSYDYKNIQHVFVKYFQSCLEKTNLEEIFFYTKIPGLATGGRDLPLLNSLHGNSTHQKTKDKRQKTMSMSMFLQVHHLLIAILLVTFFLNILFRFFLVLYAEGFLKKGALNLKLFKQLYWLLWVALVTFALIPFAITPIMLGNFPTQDSYRKQLCLGVLVHEKNEKDANPFGTKITMVIMVFYILRFVHKVKSFVHGQCPGGKMCSIGKFQRNVISLRVTSFIALILHCFFFVLPFIRELTQNMDRSKAFFVNFVVFDGFIYLLAVCVFIFARNHDMPTRKDAAKNANFYVSKVEVLQPRRPEYCNVPSQMSKRPDKSEIQEETTILVEAHFSKRAVTQPDQSTFSRDSLKPKTCDRFWIRRVVSNNKIHPIVTIYNSSAKVEPKFQEYAIETNQAKRKGYLRKESEMAQDISDIQPYIDSALTENPNAIISFPSEVPGIHVPSDDNSEKMKAVHRFSYLTKDR